MNIIILENHFSVCKLPPDSTDPEWAKKSVFYSITKTESELSVVCESTLVPEGATSESGWRALKLEGSLDFAMTGIIASIAVPLADAGIPIFSISTFETDYILVRETDLTGTIAALGKAGLSVME